MKSIGESIRQKAFQSNRHMAYINILYTSSYLSGISNKTLKPFGISQQQYNLLRILKGQHPKPASVKLLTERMMDKMSNASRLVDKLKAKGFVNRVECPEDRRQVNIGLTAAGVKLLEETTVVVNESMKFMENLSEEEAKVLSDLLDRIRQ